MKRKITAELKRWRQENKHMPFMLIGARQVGKTYILQAFCKRYYEDYVYVNLERDEDIREIFESTLKPDEIISSISILTGKKILPEKTALIIDEIQVSERAITSLKYFNESKKPYSVLCAGSLLGVALNRFSSSFPVGKVYRSNLYPMDFEEFLWAISEEPLTEAIRKAYKNCTPLLKPIHEMALRLYGAYLYVGGMPASILEFIQKEQDISLYRPDVKRRIIQDYMADMSKYTTSTEHHRISKVYRSLPKQLGHETNKFTYKLIEEGANKRKYETSIEWLIHSHLAMKCTRIEVPRLPLAAYEKENFFKLYMNDVGLLMELAGMTPLDLMNNDTNLYKGMLTENYVAQMLTATGAQLYFWKSKHSAEIDFLLHTEGQIIPIEVKAALNTKSKSLTTYCEKYHPRRAIRVSSKNFGRTDSIESVPLYAAHLLYTQ